jgi:hypothetical protein
MSFPSSVSLAALQKAGIVHSDMTQDEFDARLKRVHIKDVHARMRLAAIALEAGYFGVRTMAVPYTPMELQSPNGDTLREHRNMSPLRGMTRAGQIANIQANLDRLDTMLHPEGRTIRARSERC